VKGLGKRLDACVLTACFYISGSVRREVDSYGFAGNSCERSCCKEACSESNRAGSGSITKDNNLNLLACWIDSTRSEC